MVIEGPARSAVSKNAVTDFAVSLRQQMDLTHEAKALETLRRDVEDFELLRVPEVMRDLSAHRCLPSSICAGNIQREILDRPGVARLLCSAWLRQALMGHVFPVEPCQTNVGLSLTSRSLSRAASSRVCPASRSQTSGII